MQTSACSTTDTTQLQSPEHVRLSLAAAMTLGFTKGWFYRNARLGCINLLLTYADGCKANCAFCGISAEKRVPADKKSFIRVPWKTYPLDQVVEAMKSAPPHVGRVCISMITHSRCKQDTIEVCRRVATDTGLAVSLLISPTVLKETDLSSLKDAGADRVGVAVDAATPELFQRLRGRPVAGPHKWDHYWKIYEHSLTVFGEDRAGVHLICGLGETEKQLVNAMGRARAMGGSTHLFSFYPEKGSLMEQHPAPPLETYRRIQLARWLIDHDKTRPELMSFDERGCLEDFGVSREVLDEAVSMGEPFMTSGCPGPDGKVACNRPYGNEKPGPVIRNFPFLPEAEDIKKIKRDMLGLYA